MLIPNEMVANFPILRELAHIISYELWYDKAEHTYSRQQVIIVNARNVKHMKCDMQEHAPINT